jgi:hypothetical protein
MIVPFPNFHANYIFHWRAIFWKQRSAVEVWSSGSHILLIWAHSIFFCYGKASKKTFILWTYKVSMKWLVSFWQQQQTSQAKLDNWFVPWTPFSIALMDVWARVGKLSTSCEIQRPVQVPSIQLDICVKHNVKFKLEEASNYRKLSFHSLHLSVMNEDVKCK